MFVLDGRMNNSFRKK